MLGFQLPASSSRFTAGRPGHPHCLEQAMSKARTRLTLAIARVGQASIPSPVGCAPRCSRPGSRSATAPPARRRNVPIRQHLREVRHCPPRDAAARGWHTEVAWHSRLIASLQAHFQQLPRTAENRS